MSFWPLGICRQETSAIVYKDEFRTALALKQAKCKWVEGWEGITAKERLKGVNVKGRMARSEAVRKQQRRKGKERGKKKIEKVERKANGNVKSKIVKTMG